MHEETAMLLASYALQAEVGDYNQTLHGSDYFVPEHYLPQRVSTIGTNLNCPNLCNTDRVFLINNKVIELRIGSYVKTFLSFCKLHYTDEFLGKSHAIVRDIF